MLRTISAILILAFFLALGGGLLSQFGNGKLPMMLFCLLFLLGLQSFFGIIRARIPYEFWLLFDGIALAAVFVCWK
jgi:hypothetical protein